MNLVKITHENLENEHICCAISNNKDCQVVSKKAWLEARLDEGLVFLKGDVRGKCFIEYLPAEYAWVPIQAEGYMYIDCLWVSGQFKGQGNSNTLLDECIRDSKEKGKKGLVILSSEKKLGFLADKKYLKYKGFEVVDKAEPYFELLYLPFESSAGAEKPQFAKSVKEFALKGRLDLPSCTTPIFTIFYTNQCPFTAKYVPILEQTAKECGASFEAIHVNTREQAQAMPVPFTTFVLFRNGEFLTHEIQSANKFKKMIVG